MFLNLMVTPTSLRKALKGLKKGTKRGRIKIENIGLYFQKKGTKRGRIKIGNIGLYFQNQSCYCTQRTQ